jgi:hypothetical protein
MLELFFKEAQKWKCVYYELQNVWERKDTNIMALEASNNNLVASLKATKGVLVELNAKFLKLK